MAAVEELEEHEETAKGEEPGEETVETSLEEILAKRGEGEAEAGESEEESVLAVGRDDDRVESLAVKVVPQQPTEFVCKKCFLVKHRSQLADKKRMFCRDCV
ncbi:MAG TPA: DUF4193 family protein [Actinomycetota bacterium]|nr:DUF4193 family protein [Actinomycetota bacterium]